MNDKTERVTYSGTWHSQKWTALVSRGDVWIDLPKEFKDDETYHLTAKLKYLGIYRLREVQNIPVVLSGKKALANDHVTPERKGPDGQTLPNGVGTLEFMIERHQNDVLSGKYKLSNPEDFGEFEIKKGSSNVRNCLLM